MRAECCICGAMTEPVRYELFRYVEPLPPPADGQPPVLFDAGYRCVDRERCQGDFEALARVADPADGPRPKWNIADGPAAVQKAHSSWHARAGSTAPPDRPAIAAPVSVPVVPTRPTRRRSSTSKSPQRATW